MLESSVSRAAAMRLTAAVAVAGISMPDFLAAVDIEALTKTKAQAQPEMRTDVLVIGAGPTGLACAIEAQKAGLKVIVVDKGCLVNSLFHYPANMMFFTTPELLEIGDIPFTTAQPETHARRGARVLPQSCRALPSRPSPVRVGEDGDGRGRKFQHHGDRPGRAAA